MRVKLYIEFNAADRGEDDYSLDEISAYVSERVGHDVMIDEDEMYAFVDGSSDYTEALDDYFYAQLQYKAERIWEEPITHYYEVE